MTSTVGSATGGRVWKPTTMDRGSKILFVSMIVMVMFLIPFLTITYVQNNAEWSAETIQKTNGSLILEHTSNQTDEALTEVKNWIPTALGVNATTVSGTSLDSLEDGTTGILQLTNGSTIPFTLHNNNRTFTVEK